MNPIIDNVSSLLTFSSIKFTASLLTSYASCLILFRTSNDFLAALLTLLFLTLFTFKSWGFLNIGPFEFLSNNNADWIVPTSDNTLAFNSSFAFFSDLLYFFPFIGFLILTIGILVAFPSSSIDTSLNSSLMSASSFLPVTALYFAIGIDDLTNGSIYPLASMYINAIWPASDIILAYSSESTPSYITLSFPFLSLPTIFSAGANERLLNTAFPRLSAISFLNTPWYANAFCISGVTSCGCNPSMAAIASLSL